MNQFQFMDNIERNKKLWKEIINKPVLDYDNERDRKEIEYFTKPKPDLNKKPEKHSKDYWDDYDIHIAFPSIREEIRREKEQEELKKKRKLRNIIMGILF